MKYRWYDRSIPEVVRIVRSDPDVGLGTKEAAARLKEDGKNVINPVIKAPIRSYLFQVFSDLTAILLLAGALLSLAFRQDGVAIAMLLMMIVSYAVTVLSYTRSQRVLEDLAQRTKPTIKVIRGGKLQIVPQEKVVQGDLILLTSGDIVPADARLLDSENLRVMENNLFEVGEISEKDAAYMRAGIPAAGSAPNMVYASTVVVSGRAKAVAVETGPDTLICRLKKNQPVAACHKLDIINDLKKTGRLLGIVVLLPVFLLPILELWQGNAPIDMFLLALAVAVAAMPEFYGAFGYVVISSGMLSVLKKDRKKKGAFIKNPPALPRLAGLDCLVVPMEAFCCEDASRLAEIFDGSRIVDLSEEQPDKDALRVLRYGLISTGLYGTERLALKHQQSENIYTVQQQAILEAGEQYEIYSKKLEEEYPLFDHLEKGEKGSLFETALVHFKGQDVVVLRGDPEKVLERCTGYYKEGKLLLLDEGAKGELLALAGKFSRNNRQPVAVATKSYRYNTLMRVGEAQEDLIFEGFLAIEKPFLPDSAKEVLRMRDAGMRVIVYCREEGAENRHLARALGIATKDRQVIRRSDLVNMNEGIFKINLKEYALLEGFDSTALGYTVSVLSEEYGYKVGVFGNDLSAASLMCRAEASFAVEEERPLGAHPGEETTVVDPVWSKAGRQGEKKGCQALSFLSDVIVPPVNMEGEGGINGVAVAIKGARSIYRKIETLLFYLSFSGALRLTAMLFSSGSSFYISSVQGLALGLLFDLPAVFAIAFHKNGTEYGKTPLLKGGEGFASKFKRFSPAVALGALLSAATVFLSGILFENGVLAAEHFSSFVFCSLLFLQGGMLAVLLSKDCPPKKSVFSEPMYWVYLVAQILFLLLSFFVPQISGVTDVEFMGFGGLLCSILFSAAFFLGVSLVRWILNRKK